MTADCPAIDVAAGVIERADGFVLLARRPDDRHAGGLWEFPGGKLAPGESAVAGLVRELHEELGIGVDDAEPLLSYVHDYPDRRVRLHVFRVTGYRGTPAGREGQPLRWVAPDRLLESGLLPADAPIVDALLARRDG